jgi:hypothetical protein
MKNKVFKKSFIFVAVAVLNCDFVFSMRDFAEESKAADFYARLESCGDSVKFSLFQRNLLSVGQTFSRADFDAFTGLQSGNIRLTKQGDVIACYLFEQDLSVTYGFGFNFNGDIDLSTTHESSTGVDRGIKYAFQTNKTIKNNNPTAFYSLATDSREFHNFSLLKVKKYLFTFRYFYNSGVIDTKRRSRFRSRY